MEAQYLNGFTIFIKTWLILEEDETTGATEDEAKLSENNVGAAKEKVGARILLKMGSTFLEKDGNRKGNSGRGKVIKTKHHVAKEMVETRLLWKWLVLILRKIMNVIWRQSGNQGKLNGMIVWLKER